MIDALTVAIDAEVAVVRSLIAALYLFAFYRILKITPERWPSLTRWGKRLWIGYWPTLWAVTWFMLDAVQENLQLQDRTIGFFVAAAVISSATFFRFSGDDSTDPVYKFHLEGRNPLKWRIQKLR